ncbi:unnamed protein product [Orchesella dallaii]|uniref:Mucin-like domain-containing protein n=1 Tax=Orchesella dallaii TaxID=48710 RepID=A0ABP1RL87_9HEXA
MPTTHVSSVHSHSATIEVDQTLKKIWETEDIFNQHNSTEKEKTCENHFTRPHKHNDLGQMEELLPDQRDVNLQPFPHQRDVNLQPFPHQRDAILQPFPYQWDINLQPFPHQRDVNIQPFPYQQDKGEELPPDKRMLAGTTIQDKCLIPKDGERDSFPHGRKAESASFDMDGSSSTKQAPILQTQLMSKLCLELRKWDNNNPKVLLNTNFNSIDRNGHTCARYDLSKAPGVRWNSADDLLFLGFKPNPWQQISKRIFNPLGWLAPFQQQWSSVPLPAGKLTLKWDTEVPTQLSPRWQQYQQRLCMPAGNFHFTLEELSVNTFTVMTIEFPIINKYLFRSKLHSVTAHILKFVCNAHSSSKMSRFSRDLCKQELQCSIAGKKIHAEPNFLLVGKRMQKMVLPTSIPVARLTIGSTTISMKGLSTIIYKAVEVFISFQLLLMSSNPDGYDELTPAQFLIGRQITSLSAADYTEITSLPAADYTEITSLPAADYTEITSLPAADYTEITSLPAADYTEITSLPAADYTEITSLPAVDHTKFISLSAAHHTKFISLPAVDDTKIISLPAADYTEINSLLAAFHSTANTNRLSHLENCHKTSQILWQRWHPKYFNFPHSIPNRHALFFTVTCMQGSGEWNTIPLPERQKVTISVKPLSS